MRSSTTTSPAVPGEPTAATGPLSWNQVELLRFQRSAPDSPMWNLHKAWRINGPLDVDVLQRSVAMIVERHHILRTTYREALQVVGAVPDACCRVVPVPGDTAAEREQRAQEICQAEAAHAFDLTRGPVIRVVLLELAADDHVLAVTIHHIATDGRSITLFWDELSVSYGALVTGAEPRLPPVSRQYVDHALAQRRVTATTEHDLPAWSPRLLEVARKVEATRRDSFAADLHIWAVPAPLYAAVRDFADRADSTVPEVLLTGMLMAVAHRDGIAQPAVVQPMLDRHDSAYGNTMGYFTNRALVSPPYEGTDTVLELHAKVRESLRLAEASKDIPHERVLEAVVPRRDATSHPLTQYQFQFVDASFTPLELDGMQTSLFSPGLPYVRAFDVETTVVEDQQTGGLAGYSLFAPDRRERADVARIFQDTVHGVSSLVTTPDLAVRDIDFDADTGH